MIYFGDGDYFGSPAQEITLPLGLEQHGTRPGLDLEPHASEDLETEALPELELEQSTNRTLELDDA
jgi:hypothetical protein